MSLVYAFITAICNSLVAACGKAAEQKRLKPAGYAIVFQAAASVVCLASAFGDNLLGYPPLFWALAVAMGVGTVRALASIVTANGYGPASFPWALANLALVIPIVLAALWLDEPLVWMDGGVFAAFLTMIVLFVLGLRTGPGDGDGNPRRYGAALAEVFLSNGAVMFGFKLKQAWFGAEGTAGFMAVVFASGTLVGCVTPTGRAWLSSRPGASGSAWKWAMAAGGLSAVGDQCLMAAARLPAAVVFPIVQGAGLLGGVLVTSLVFHERFNAWKIGALLAGFVVIVMAAFR